MSRLQFRFGEDSTGKYVELLCRALKTHHGGLNRCKSSTKSVRQYVAMKTLVRSTATIY